MKHPKTEILCNSRRLGIEVLLNVIDATTAKLASEGSHGSAGLLAHAENELGRLVAILNQCGEM